MSNKIKKAYKLIKKHEKQEKKQKENQSWAMYEPAGCFACHNGQIYSGGKTELDITYYKRCKCSKQKTEKYKKFLKDSCEMKMKDYLKMECQFYDNNNHITEGNNAVDRSW